MATSGWLDASRECLELGPQVTRRGQSHERGDADRYDQQQQEAECLHRGSSDVNGKMGDACLVS